MSLKQYQLPAFLRRYLPQHHRLAHIIQNLQILHRQFFKHPVRQPLKADNINIHCSMIRMKSHNILLCLHGKLFRYKDKIPLLRML